MTSVLDAIRFLILFDCRKSKEVKVVNTKSFILVFVSVYLLVSLPAMLGIGYLIDWIPEAMLLQKLKGYVIDGFTHNYLFNIVFSAIASGIFYFLFIKTDSQS